MTSRQRIVGDGAVSTRIKLYSFVPFDRSCRVRWLAHELGIGIDEHRLDYAGGEQKTDAYLALHPFGKVPCAIIDEVPPYLWRGPKAFQAWSADLDADAKKNGITEPSVAISAATRTESNGDQAYVVVPTVYTFKQGGVPMREAAQMTFVLKKGASGWLIHGWTWTGPKPQKAAAK